MRFKDGILVLEVFPELLVVVDFTVDSEDEGAVFVDERLGAGVDADDGQTLVDQNAVIRDDAAGPIGASVSHSGEAKKNRGEGTM